MMEMKFKTPAPLYRDPVFDGAADPVIIYNHLEKEWWMIYTQRRAVLSVVGVSSSHGTALGVASSDDGGVNWIYRGILNLSIDRGHNTFWAPEIIYEEKTQTYHMYTTYIRGVPYKWGQSKRGGIAHFTSKNLWDWDFESFIARQRQGIIDACVHVLPNGKYRMWFRGKGCSTCAMDSEDLYNWGDPFLAVDDEQAEGPNVFHFKGYYWLITDPLGHRHGLAVYRSSNLDHWEKQGYILQDKSIRPLDNSPGRHADVCVSGDNAYIVYFTQPYKDYLEKTDFEKLPNIDYNRCVIQVAKLDVIEGKLACNRNENFLISL